MFADNSQASQQDRKGEASQHLLTAPALALPKGGGALRGIGEKFAANPITGTGSLNVPLATSPGRAGFGPQLALSYDSGAGNGSFGFGWHLALPAITRKTERGLPQYRDGEESDVFVLSGTEDLVPMLVKVGVQWKRQETTRTLAGVTYRVQQYRPRIEGLFSRIERWTNVQTGEIHWRSISKDNITTLYGQDNNSRIFDPADDTTHPQRIFSWLICVSYDDKGNVITYEYKAENADGIDLAQANERNRTITGRTANRYLKRVRYGNLPSCLVQSDLTKLSWLFEVVFDYGEHNLDKPTPDEEQPWLCRNDPFSSYRSAFEVRTYRLCQRVLMFHHFPDEPTVSANCLVRSTDFLYQNTRNNPDDLKRGNPLASFLASVTQHGYIRQQDGSYLEQTMPSLEFAYSQVVLQSEVQELDVSSLENLPAGLDGANYRWVDLDAEGVAGILTEQAGAWFYKPNLGNGQFGPLGVVAYKPALQSSHQQLLSLGGDGRLDLVDFSGALPGFFKRTDDEQWDDFTAFAELPQIAWQDPNLRFADLDGDGFADVLITEHEALTWHPSLAEAGFAPAQSVSKPFDEERGPRLVFADGSQSVYLADMSGDGLSDLVRVRNGEVCYWPNLGYGRFGSKVSMDNAPWFASNELFDQQRVRLADIDGSGTSDLLYLGSDAVQVYFNLAGNAWSEKQTLSPLPHLDRLSAVVIVDLLGNGTACLVWSSPLPADARRPLRYIDLMGGQKPHLLLLVKNNLGAETSIQYASSTRFYLNDKLAGKPWLTRLPFPVHVVERIEVRDHIAGTRFVTRYAYHHGYYDGPEREFRGFGMVEQFDSESFEDYVLGVTQNGGNQDATPELYQPPAIARTWFHTGALLSREIILHQMHDEYYQQKHYLPEPLPPAGLDEQEYRECLRALKGLPLRQEIYSFDDSPQAFHPYSVLENTFTINLVQPRGTQRHAVFFTTGAETMTHYFERNPGDPRVTHTLNLEVDQYGHVLKSALVIYGRQTTDASLPAEVTREQQRTTITYGELDYTTDFDLPDPTPVYRLRVPCESRRYEITGIAPTAGFFQLQELKDKIAGAAAIDYETLASGSTPQKRLLAQTRALFLDNNLQPLPPGQWDTLALPYESYQLAFTPGVVSAYYTQLSASDFSGAGYVHFNNDSNWWIPSGIASYPSQPAAHFYLSSGTRDPLGLESVVTRDKYDLLSEQVQIKQAPWHLTSATNDYRVLGPVMLTDPNKNRVAIEIDALGIVVKSALMGKEGASEGDTLVDPTTRVEYDLFNWLNHGKPNYTHVFAREQHGAANPRWQERYIYSNGSGGIAMTKAQAHPGKALRVNPDGSTSEVDANPRWVGNGRTILNNKGNPVKQYEPFFSTTHEYEDEKALRELGTTPVLYYDAVGRNIRTIYPNGTLARVEFDAWLQRVFDANDAAKQSQWYADRGSPDPNTQPEPVSDAERRAAWLAAKHDNTPGLLHLDSLSRTIYAISDYGAGKTAAVRTESDLSGRYSRMFDQQQRVVASGFMGMAGTPIYSESAERGKRWLFVDVLGNMVRSWNEQGRTFRTEYDELHRVVGTFVQESRQPEILFSYVVYGDRAPNAQQFNLLGTAHQVFDQAGLIRVQALDFKGNPTAIDRVLAKDYTKSVDWSVLRAQPDYTSLQNAATALLESEVFSASSTCDALSRPTRLTLPDGTVLLPSYNEANFLASLQGQVRGQGAFLTFLQAQDYDAKGQRQFAHYGNDLYTRYLYDPKTYRLTNLLTYKSGDDPATQSLQNLFYTYDPVGNITQVEDSAQQTHYFSNAVVKPENLYEYDALYQLIRATGREHAGQGSDAIPDSSDLPFVTQLPHVNDAAAVRSYTEIYTYDMLGNLISRQHSTGSGRGNWTQHYHYAYADNPADRTNRLVSSSSPGDPDAGPYSATYSYDLYGNMISMPALSSLTWNVLDQLQQVNLGGGGTAYYVYGAGGQRVRKVIERQGSLRVERIYLGAVEIYRERQGANAPNLERFTLHISDNVGRIAQVDTKTIDSTNSDPANPLNTPLIRYQYTNHLGSATLETDASGQVISYEEYHPYGTSAYRSGKPGVNLSLKRYRFSGKEHDDETGLYYFGARYYAAWLGRWTSSDPAGFVDGFNLFKYCMNNPVMLSDKTGHQSNKPLNPVGQVSWEIPASIFMDTKTGQRYDDAKVLHNVAGWLAREHPDRSYTPGTLKIDTWVDRTTARGRQYQVPLINAEWLDKQGKPLLPRVGEFGSVAPMRKQPKAEYGTPGVRSTILTENEHTTPNAQNKAIDPSYNDTAYKNDATVRSPRGVSLDKTQVDNASSAAIKQRVANGQPINVTEDIDMPSNANFQRANDAAKAAGRPSINNPGSINRGTLEQMGNRFERGKGASLPAGAQIEEPDIKEYNPPKSPGAGGGSGIGTGFGSNLARTFLPGFAEAEVTGIFAEGIVAQASPYLAAAGMSSASLSSLSTTAAAISASPTQFAFSVTLPAYGGAIVGNAAESLATSLGASKEVSIGTAVVAAAATGAIIGTFIPIPGVGTAVGAVIGAAIGVIGYGLSKLLF